MAPRFVGLNSTFDQQRIVINDISVDIENLTSSGIFAKTNVGIHTLSNVGIGTTNPLTALDIAAGTITFGRITGPYYGDVSIGNTLTSYGYTEGGFGVNNPRYKNNIFIGNEVYSLHSSGDMPAYNVVIGDRAGQTLGEGCTENVIIGRDAGYVNVGNGNNFIGMRAGQYNTSGYINNFIGYDAGNSNTTGGYNNFIGNEAGYTNTTGNNNFYGGQYTGYYNQGGNYNLALGSWAANGFSESNTTQSYNIHLGAVNGGTIGGSYQVLIGSGNASGSRYFDLPNPNKSYQFAVGIRTDANPSKYWLVGDENFNVGIGTTNPKTKLEIDGTLGFTKKTISIGDTTTAPPSIYNLKNIFIGVGAGASNALRTNGGENVYIGSYAGSQDRQGQYNVLIGPYAGYEANDFAEEVRIGSYAGANSSGVYSNILIGRYSGGNNSGNNNIIIGENAGYNNSFNDNTIVGSYAGYDNSGYGNNFFGNGAGYSNTDGNNNNYIGYYAGWTNTTGRGNIFFGSNSGISTSASYKVVIGSGNGYNQDFDSPDTTKDTQFAVGVRTSTAPSKYWLVGNENFNVGIGTTNPTAKLDVNGDLKVSGNLNAPGNYYVKLARTTDQTALNGADTLIGFSVISDPNNWYSGITTRTTPTVAGTYHVDLMINWLEGTITNNQTNIQIRKNGNTFALSQVGIHTFAYTQNACGIVTMNGTTDYIDATVYTSNPTSQNIRGTGDGAWTKMEIFKIN